MGNPISNIWTQFFSGTSGKKARRGLARSGNGLPAAEIQFTGTLEPRTLLSATNGAEDSSIVVSNDPMPPEILEDTATGLLAEYDRALHRLTITGTSGSDNFTFEVRDNQMIIRIRETWSTSTIIHYIPGEIPSGPGYTSYFPPERFLIFSTPADQLVNVQISLGDSNDSVTIADSVSASILVEIDAGAGDDVVTGGAGNDTIIGGDGNDFLQGRGGNDQIDGRAGNDSLNGGEGNDTLWGGEGNDAFYWDRVDWTNGSAIVKNGEDVVFAGSGTDVINFSSFTSGITFDLGSTIIQAIGTTDDPGAMVLLGSGDDVENIFGAQQGANFLTGNSLDNEMYGGDGGDILIGKEGNDTLYGYNGNDQLDGREGDDNLNGGKGNDILIGDAGNDTFDFNTNDYPLWLAIDDQANFVAGLVDSLAPINWQNDYKTEEGDDVVIDVLGVTQINLSGKSAVNITTPTPGQPVRKITDRLGFSVNIVSGFVGQQFQLSNTEVNF